MSNIETKNNTYVFASLDPRPIPAAQESNDKVFSLGPVYGLEVTNPKLAARCVVNIDPQHGPQGTTESSAIEAAMTVDLPPAGAVLATIRPDRDSVGAMAVLSLRLNGQEADIDHELVTAIGRMDALGPQARELEVVEAHRNEIVAADYICLGRKHSLEEKVAWMSELLTGHVSDGVVLGFAEDVRTELEKAKATLEVARLTDNVAFVRGNSPRGFEVGYATGAPIVACLAPNFLRPGAAEGEQPCQKWTIARYSAAAPLAMAELKAALNAAEEEFGGAPEWGGPADLVASPQGRTPSAPPERILAAVFAAVHQPGTFRTVA